MDTTLADPLVGRLIDGRYRVESRIARGGMATVYLAMDTRLDRTVALKIMHRSLAEDPAFVRRFSGEAKAVARLAHPNVVQVFDQGRDGDIVYLSMEYVPGRTLRDELRERGRLAPREALEILIPVLAALAAAHQIGMIHRDVKPENVLIAEDGRVKVADFGLARAIEVGNQTRTGVMIGTVGYMAPEQVTEGRADPRSDVYAAGVMLYELLTGRPPFEGQSPMAVAYKHVHETVPAPSALVPGSPPMLDALVAGATARDPAARPADASALLVAAVETHRALSRETAPPLAAPVPGSATIPPPPPGEASTATGRPAPATPTLIQPREELPADTSGHDRREGRRRLRPNWFLVGLAVVMVIGIVLSGWYFSQGTPVKVPDLVGKNLTVARSEAENRGFKVKIGKGVHHDEVPTDGVVRMEPAAGTEVEPGSLLTLIPSLGPRLVTVPDLAGLSEDAAKAQLKEAGLKVDDVTRVPDPETPRGQVLRTSPRAGAEVKPGSKIDVVVSAGLVMPDVRGMPRDQAAETLEGQGFVVDVQERNADAEPCTVISQSPEAETPMNRGDDVTLIVARCHRGFPWPWENGNPFEMNVIPNVLSKPVRQAERELRAAGFDVTTRKLFRRGGNHVRFQAPRDVPAPPGTRVTLWH